MKLLLLTGSTLGFGLLLGSLALGQPIALREGKDSWGAAKGAVRIIKGTLDKVSKDGIAVKVESIFVPRQGELENPPRRLEISIGERLRAVKGMDRGKSIEDFSPGEKVVVIATYDEEKGYLARVIMDPESALKARERMGQFMQRRGGARDKLGRPFGKDRFGRGAIGARIPPAFNATFLGFGDKAGTVKLLLESFYRPRVSDGDRPAIGRELPNLPEQREIVVKVADKAKVFREGEKAELSDFKKGEKVVVMIRGFRFREGAEPVLLLLADEQSAQKFRELFRERFARRHPPEFKEEK